MTDLHFKTIALLAGSAIASGCASMADDTYGSVAGQNTVSSAEFKSAQSRVTELESALADRDRQLANKAAFTAGSDAPGNSMAASTSLFPPNPKTGECYARALIPAKYRSVSAKILTQDAAERIEIIPARYATSQERVLIKEASTQLQVVPAVYENVKETVLVRPASTKIVEVPAQYRTVTEQVVDKPAHTAWKKGPAAAQSSTVLSTTTTDTGEIMCLIEVPATYKTVQKRVLVSPAGTEKIAVPAEYKTIAKTVVAKPATTREVIVPAQYDTVEVSKLVTAAKENRIAIPASYESVSRDEKVSDERMEWRQVMCEVNMTNSNVMALQRALAGEGYYKASVDGIIGSQTLSAARAFAIDNNLPAGSNYVPMEVVKKLNLDM